MRYSLVRRVRVPTSALELQVIAGSDGSTWIRVSDDIRLLRVWSALETGAGVVPTDEVVEVIAVGMTASTPRLLLNHLRFSGWDLWPGIPSPLGSYLAG